MVRVTAMRLSGAFAELDKIVLRDPSTVHKL
jgi:hypothetical protein